MQMGVKTDRWIDLLNSVGWDPFGYALWNEGIQYSIAQDENE